MACGGRLKLSDFWLNHDDAGLFARSQWPIHRFIYLAWRVFLALYLLGWLVGHLATSKSFGGFFVFLTDWTFMVLTFYAVSSCIGTLYFTYADRGNPLYTKSIASHPPNATDHDLRSTNSSPIAADQLSSLPPQGQHLEGARSPRLPYYFKLVWLMFNVCLAVDPIVTVVYWSFLASPKYSTLGLVLNIHLHALNTVFIYADLLVSAMPVRILHFVYAIMYGILYIGFTLIYYWAGGVNPYTGETAIYPRVLDWSRAGWTILSVVVIIFAAILTHLAGYGCYRLRVYVRARFFSDGPEETCVLTKRPYTDSDRDQ